MSQGGGAFVGKRDVYSEDEEKIVLGVATQIVKEGRGKRADLVAQGALDAVVAIWGWCGVTQEQAVAVMTAQASRLPHQN